MSSGLLGKRKKQTNPCPNPLFVQWLTEWRDEAAEKGWKSQYTYGKALKTLKKYPLGVSSGKDCKFLENFGDKICKMLDDKLSKHIALYGTTAAVPTGESSSQPLPTGPCADKKARSRSPEVEVNEGLSYEQPADIPAHEGLKRRQLSEVRGQREYIPQFRSGAYALLVTLYRNMQQVNSRGYMTKLELIREAQPLADKSFTIPDPGGRYTSWSSMGTLINKLLVVKESSPAKYRLTEAGCELAHRLLHVEPTLDSGAQDNTSASSDKIHSETGQSAGNTTGSPIQNAASEKILPVTEDSYEGDSNIRAPQFQFWYVTQENELVKYKDQAAVLIDDSIGIGFLVKAKYSSLLASGLRYQLDDSRSSEFGERYAYIHNDDASDLCSPPPSTINLKSLTQQKGFYEKSQSKQLSQTVQGPEVKIKNTEDIPVVSQVFVASFPATASRSTKDIERTAVTFSRSTNNFESQISGAKIEKYVLPTLRETTSSLSQDSTTSGESMKSLPVAQFTMDAGTFDIVLCVDNQEHYGSGKKGDLLPELLKNGVDCNVRKLQVGDFLWIAKEKVKHTPGLLQMPKTRELVLDYIIERKRMDDLAGSIIDGRFKEQKFRLKNCGLRKPIYLVEDYGSTQHFSVKEDTLNQAIVNTQVIDGFYVKRTKDLKESVAYLTIMTRYLQSIYKNKCLHACSKNELDENGGESVIDSSVQMLMTYEEFSQYSIKSKALTVKEVFGKMLMQLHGMSGEKALSITDHFPTLSHLVQKYESCASEKEKETLLAKLKFGSMNRNLGAALSKTVYQLYNTSAPLQ
ncbi:crossover junction endonuclease MUS81 isoform X2 [Lingula anatina]|uniref:Crossover junction endonuclease MUS81 n=1 Tax=Lingula anatina TaxID=7574 RepID=A0A1S3HGZ9_LINAN|nr:crossover junction endonuclease MUS81 isoform X2 [Lingula anatina]|eukprot:XP_013385302.1 crossover junction endonuclease MUS81 isoform X2 [Lingula anatina]